MHRTTLTTVLVALLALAAVLAFAAGCGGDGEELAAEAPQVAELTAEEIVAQSEQAMQDIMSASFNVDLSIKVEGDPSAASDPQAQALMQSPITLKASGASSDEPVAADLSMTFGLMGQNIKMEMRAKDDQAWVAYEDQWYKVPAEDSKNATGQLSEGALPTEQLEDIGLDPDEWDLTWELVGTEDLAGTQVYHVKGTADAAKFAESLLKALDDPQLAEKLGADAAQQLQGTKAQSEKELEQLQKALEDVSVDTWYEVETFYLRKVDAKAAFDMTGLEDAEGVTAMDFTMLVELNGFNEPVEVEAPKDAQPLEKLMEAMFGGMSLEGMDL
ncbi:MAG: LppX_LprAFG lipoprotein [Thermoleophilia bacterium]|nr:LppX_LprAFG lipoprotein [Thermoleophilia bacterium]